MAQAGRKSLPYSPSPSDRSLTPIRGASLSVGRSSQQGFPGMRPLWRFSAMIRLAMGGDHPWARQRIEWSLPENRADAAADRAGTWGVSPRSWSACFNDLIPASAKSFDALTTLAQQFGAKPAAPPSH